MKPPMHDPVILMQPILVDGEPQKDDNGFPELFEYPVMGRVTEESTLVKDQKGEERQATYTVCLPSTVTPNLGDELKIGDVTVSILKRSARKSYSGTKIYYWVTNCGE